MRRRGSSPTTGRAKLVLVIAAAICLAPRAGRAQDTPANVVVDVGDCVGLNATDRLACFDRHVEGAKPNRQASPAPQTSAAAPSPTTPTDAVAPAPAARSAPAAQTATAAAPVAATASAAATITVPAPAEAAPVTTSAAAPAPSASTSASAQRASAPSTGHDNAPSRDAEAKPLEIVATVTELHETVPNAWLITLDNGQVWRQNPPQRFALKTGQRVTLRTSKWGVSYRLSADALNGFIQVERVR
jgi:hypothetical protein